MSSETSTPDSEYQTKMVTARDSHAQLEISDRNLSILRAVLFLILCFLSYLSFSIETLSWPWLLLPSFAFLGCIYAHRGVSQKMEDEEKRMEYYRKCLLRVEGQWHTFSNTGARYCDTDHPFSGDLDIFGQKSLFQLLCLARTRIGEDTLAAWLQKSASREEIELRQHAVEELRNQALDREEHALLDDKPLPDQMDENSLLRWAEQPFSPVSNRVRLSALVLSGISISAISLYLLSIVGPTVLILAILLQVIVLRSFKLNVKTVEQEVNQVSQRLRMLMLVLRRIEARSFQASKLKDISAALYTESLPPSVQVARLDSLIRYLSNSLRNQLFVPFAMLLCLPVHLIYFISRWHASTGIHIRQWVSAAGEYEALSSLAGFAYENPQCRFPVISSSRNHFVAEQIGHPLIAKSDCVLNDFVMKEPLSLVMISGSNMSGKSTFLRTVGINIVLAMSGSVVRADSLELSPFSPATCMRINDSLQNNTSYFYAVISRLKLILELVDNSRGVFFLLDEILSGTNSHDRRIGAERIISHLVGKDAIGLVTTHDLALTDIAEKLQDRALNIHFEDQLKDGDMYFDYKIRSGVVHRSNALALMKMIGIEE